MLMSDGGLASNFRKNVLRTLDESINSPALED